MLQSEEKKWLPNLQLSLRHSFDNGSEMNDPQENTKEIDTMLSLSLSPSSSRKQALCTEKHKDVTQIGNWDLQTNFTKATFGIST